MVIAIDIRLLGRGRTGDEAVFFNLTRELVRIDREHTYLLLTDRSEASFLSDLRRKLGIEEAANVNVISLAGRNRFVWNLLSIPFFLFREKPDIFHTQYILPMLIPKRTKVVTHIHDVSFRVFPELISRKDRLFLSLLIPRTCRRSDLLAVPSQFTKDEVVSWYGVDPGKVVVVPNAISPDFLGGLSEDRLKEVKEKYRLPESFLLSVGTLQPRKNLPFLIRAFSEVKKQAPELSLVLVGNRSAHHFDPGIDRAIEETGSVGSVIFPGFVDQEDLPALYRLARGLVFPSRYEGFGIPLLEAFVNGVPVAASDIPPFREVGADAALYFRLGEPGDIAECAKTLYTLVTETNIRNRCVEAGHERVRAYSWEKSARVLLFAYISVSKGHR